MNPNARRVSIILINTTNHNIWIRQPVLVANIFKVEVEPWQYCIIMEQERGEIIIRFQPVPPQESNTEINIIAVEVTEKNGQEQKEIPLPVYGDRPDTSKEYIF